MNQEIPNNSVLEVKLDYIQNDIKQIKNDVREIKQDFISRREYETGEKDYDSKIQTQMETLTEKVALLNRVLYWTIAVVGLSLVTAFLRLVIK